MRFGAGGFRADAVAACPEADSAGSVKMVSPPAMERYRNVADAVMCAWFTFRFVVCVDERLLGFDLVNDGALGFEGRERDGV